MTDSSDHPNKSDDALGEFNFVNWLYLVNNPKFLKQQSLVADAEFKRRFEDFALFTRGNKTFWAFLLRQIFVNIASTSYTIIHVGFEKSHLSLVLHSIAVLLLIVYKNSIVRVNSAETAVRHRRLCTFLIFFTTGAFFVDSWSQYEFLEKLYIDSDAEYDVELMYNYRHLMHLCFRTAMMILHNNQTMRHVSLDVLATSSTLFCCFQVYIFKDILFCKSEDLIEEHDRLYFGSVVIGFCCLALVLGMLIYQYGYISQMTLLWFNLMWNDHYEKFAHEEKMQKSQLGVSSEQRDTINSVLKELKGPGVSRKLKGKLNIIKYSDIIFESAIGNGSFGLIFSARHYSSVVAIKQLLPSQISRTNILLFVCEMKILR